MNLANRLVIFLPVGDRWFAVCFGYGSSALEWDAVDSNFGLRVAARRFRADVTEVRSRRIDASARTQSVQLPLGADLKDLGIELEGEFVRKLSGKIDESGGIDVDGAVAAGDSIAFNATVDLHTVQEVLEQMLLTVSQTTVRDEFQFVDSLEPIRSTEALAKALDRDLAAELLETRTAANPSLTVHVLEFAPPDDVKLDEVDEILVSFGERESRLSTFTVGALRSALDELGIRRGRSFLRGVRLLALGADGEERSQMLPLRSWLVFEAGDHQARFVLTLGRWFRLQEAYTTKLDADLRNIADLSLELALPDTSLKEHEGDYNERAASERDDLIMMDKVYIGTEDGTQVEACDLLHRSGHLIHVKRYNGSQTLSHLFSQGAVSAELLNIDSKMKGDFVQRVEERDSRFKEVAEQAPNIVTYAIAIQDGRDLPVDLPTFSKVNLRDFARRLQRMKVRPTIARIRAVG